MVVGITTEENLPAGAVLITSGDKDPLPPPPPPPPSLSQLETYRQAVQTWMTGGRDEDE
jgi:hypothetical protein